MLKIRKVKWVYFVMLFLLSVISFSNVVVNSPISGKDVKIIKKILKEYGYSDEQIAQKISSLTPEKANLLKEKIAGKGLLVSLFGATLGPVVGYILAILGIVSLDLWWENKSLDEI